MFIREIVKILYVKQSKQHHDFSQSHTWVIVCCISDACTELYCNIATIKVCLIILPFLRSTLVTRLGLILHSYFSKTHTSGSLCPLFWFATGVWWQCSHFLKSTTLTKKNTLINQNLLTHPITHIYIYILTSTQLLKNHIGDADGYLAVFLFTASLMLKAYLN